MQSTKDALIILVGPSGVGCTTIARTLVQQGIATKMVRSVTDRPKDPTEDNDEYMFVPKGTINVDDCVEHITFDEFTYGVLKTELHEAIDSGRAVVRTDINGARQLKNYCTCPVISIFVDATNEELRKRLISRGRGRVDNRLALATKIRLDIDECDFYMVNSDGLLRNNLHNIDSIYRLVGA